VLAQGSSWNCAAALGFGGEPSDAAPVIDVQQSFVPPRVDRAAGGQVRRLTAASTTTGWMRVWVAAWCALAVGLVALAAGSVSSWIPQRPGGRRRTEPGRR